MIIIGLRQKEKKKQSVKTRMEDGKERVREREETEIILQKEKEFAVCWRSVQF
jgi:hypothetical protein